MFRAHTSLNIDIDRYIGVIIVSDSSKSLPVSEVESCRDREERRQ